MFLFTANSDCSWAGATPVRRRRSGWHLAIAMLREWRRRSRSRAALAALDDRMLRDIGVTRCDARREIDKPFWRE